MKYREKHQRVADQYRDQAKRALTYPGAGQCLLNAYLIEQAIDDQVEDMQIDKFE